MSTFREPVFNLENLTNSDTVITWLLRTNEIIDSLNSLYLSDVFEGDGICTTRSGGIVTIKIDAGPGLGFNAAKELTLNFNNLGTLTSISNSPTQSTDYGILSRSGLFYKVALNEFLPTTLLHQHTFSDTITFSKKIESSGIYIKDIDTDISGGEINYTYNNEYGYPNGLNLKTTGLDTGINISPEAFIRTYYPEYIAGSDGVSPAYENTDFIGVGNSEDTFFRTANFNFATTHFEDAGDPGLIDGPLMQNAISLNFYTGTEGNNGTGVPYVKNAQRIGTTELHWPMKWSLKFTENEFLVAPVEGYRISAGGTGALNTYNALKYTYNQNSSLGVFEITGKISITNLQGSDQFVSAPNGINKVALTGSDGLLNKKFTNRITTTNIGTLSVGSIVYVGTLTDGVVEYKKALADVSGNYDVIGIVESISAGQATIVLNGEFELSGVTTLEVGSRYYLSQTSAGNYVLEGTYTTGILKPVFIAISESKGILIDAITDNSTIGSISVLNNDLSTETLDIDSPNYALTLVGGPNIRLDVNSNNEIEINVQGLTGSQMTFKSIQVDGVGSTDGDHFVIAETFDDNVKFVSNTLKIIADDTAKEILFEAPDAFTNFKFTDDNGEYVYSAEMQYDTMHFVAGTGITFTENTDDSIIISATIEGGISADDLVFGGPFEIPVSVKNGSGQYVSLLGANDGENFASGYYTAITLELDPDKQITRASASNDFVYDGVTYNHTPGGQEEQYWPAVQWTYLPDALAGYMIGRITSTPLDDGSGTFRSSPDNKIRRLSRRDVRHFLGIAEEGFIDTIGSVFSSWTIDNSATIVTATSKSGTLKFLAGSGIQLTNPTPGTDDKILITNTGVPQNAFGSVTIKTYTGDIIDTYDAQTSSDNFTLKSGRFIRISTDTNNDTAIFDIDIEDDYVLLGNPGTSDGMAVISLQNEPYSLVGRAGGSIEAINSDTLKWTGTGASPVEPIMELPYFGAVLAENILLNAYGTGKGILRFTAGAGITLNPDSNTNTIEILADVDPSALSGRVESLGINSLSPISFSTVGGINTNKIRFQESTGIRITGNQEVNGSTAAVLATFSLEPIQVDSLLANVIATGTTAAPQPLTLTSDTVLAKIGSNRMAAIPFTGTGGLRENLQIPRISAIGSSQDTSARTYLTIPGNVVNYTSNTLLSFKGVNINVSAAKFTASETGFTGQEGIEITISSSTTLSLDSAPSFFGTKLGTGTTTDASLPLVNFINAGLFNVSTDNLNATRYIVKTATVYNGNVASPGTMDVVYREMVLPAPSTVPELVTNKTCLDGSRTNKRSYAAVSGTSQDIIYSRNHVIGVYDASVAANGGSTLASAGGSLTIRASDISLVANDASPTISLNARTVSFSNGMFTNTDNILRLNASSGGTYHIAAYNNLTSSPNSSAAAGAPLQLHSTSLRFVLNGTPASNTTWFNLVKNGTTSTQVDITASDTININNNMTIGGSGKTITFAAGTTVTGLNVATHSSSHTSVDSLSTHVSGTLSFDAILAWQVGAINRFKPTMLNAIGIASADGFFDYDVSELNGGVYQTLLFNGTSTFDTTAYSSTVTNADRGPLYIVVPTGTDPTTGVGAAVTGPPGQIIFVRA